MRLPLICIWMVAAAAYAADEPMTISAEHADYQDRVIRLEGNVVVEHELGKMCAQQVEIRGQPHDKRPRVGTIVLNERVNIALTDSGQLTCASANIDYANREGVFSGDVIYTETCRGRKQEAIPLIVKGQRMVLDIAPEDEADVSTVRGAVRRIDVAGSVNVNYNHDFIASADSGTYRREGTPADEGRPAGTITLLMDNSERRCKVVNKNGDLISASTIVIDTASRELAFEHAVGTIRGAREGNKGDQRIDFSAGRLLWDSGAEKVTLQDDVKIDQEGLGNLTSDGEVRIFQQSHANKKQLKMLETEGKTVIIFKEPGKGAEHTLTSYGPVAVDHINLLTTVESPKGPKGRVRDDDQVAFTDEQGEVYADKALLTYGLAGGKVVLEKVRLEGHVRLTDKKPDGSDVLHYTIADVVEYTPADKEMTFTAKARRRVLFYDRVNNVQVSAPALKVKRDAAGKDSVRGIGDVRFSFIEQEYAQLRKRFKIDPTEASPL